MKLIHLLFGCIRLPGSIPVDEHQLTHFLVVATRHNVRPWWKRLTRLVVLGYQDPFKD